MLNFRIRPYKHRGKTITIEFDHEINQWRFGVEGYSFRGTTGDLLEARQVAESWAKIMTY